MKSIKLPRLTLLALAAAASAPALANPVLGASTSAAVASGAASPNDYTWAGPPAYSGSNTYANDSTGNASGGSFANGNGAYAVSSSATGVGNASAHSQFLYTLVNTSAVAQSYTMNFHIYGGSISTNLHGGATLSGNESMFAQYGARISVGGNTLFSSGASITQNAGGISATQSGTNLNVNDDGSDGYYQWGSGDYSVELGVLAAGASIDILAEVDDMVFADVGTYTYSGCGGYGYGYGGYGYGGYGNCEAFKGQANAFYGDPLTLQGWTDQAPPTATSFNGTPLAANDVPEPTSWALALLALGAAGLARRRR